MVLKLLPKKSKSKKALSGVVSMVILVGLVIGAIAMVWVIVKNLVEDKLGEAGTCFGVFEKITLEDSYTCSNSSSVVFMISVGNITVEEILVAVYDDSGSKSFRIPDSDGETGFMIYGGVLGGPIPSLGANSGQTYIIEYESIQGLSKPKSIKIAPKINGKLCGDSDSILQISDCSLLAQ
ncbi:MAG: hypothetical protein ACE5ES_03195 [Candidatus Nanoarchaeia archaeon]